jgi:hypothetical protein
MSCRCLADIRLAERKRPGLEASDLRVLRYRGVMELALADCDNDEIASFSGHRALMM